MTTPKKPSAAVQAQIDAAVQEALKSATAGLVQAASKPQEIENLRKTWRASAEHKAAQVKLFLSTLFGLVALQAVGDFSTGKDLTHLLDTRALLTYLAPIALVAWRQIHPALTSSQADSAPGMTIVPEQTQATDGAVVDPAPPAPVLTAAGGITGLGGVPVADDAVGAGPAEGDAAP